MRAIKVTFHAVFEQPIGKLNPMGMKMPGLIPVEIFGTGERWQARTIPNGPGPSAVPSVFNRLGRFASLEHAKSEVIAAFQQQVQDWQVWGTPPIEMRGNCQFGGHEQMLTPYEVADLGEGKFGWIQDEDRTHIIHAPTIPPGAKIPPAACGASVNAKCFISTKANIEPSCKGCKKVWEREYKGK
jgi:hypothetical protein